jgi:hypothetical protein
VATVVYFAKHGDAFAQDGTLLQIWGTLFLSGSGVVLKGDSAAFVPLNFERATDKTRRKTEHCMFGGGPGFCSGYLRGRAEICTRHGELTTAKYPCLAVGAVDE